MKRLVSVFLAALMLLGFAGCKPAVNPDDGAPRPQASGAGSAITPERTEKPKLGTLELMSRDKSLTITALQISGDKAGSKEFNAREPAMADIRCIFEQDEQIDVVLSYNSGAEGVCALRVAKHRDFSEYAELRPEEYSIIMVFSELETGFEEIFTLDKELFEPGEYDLLFARTDSIIACVTIRVFEASALSSMPDEELESLMKEVSQ